MINLDCEQSLFFLQLATRRESRETLETRAADESLSCFVPFLSRAFSHARVHSRAFCSKDLEKRETARSLAMITSFKPTFSHRHFMALYFVYFVELTH